MELKNLKRASKENRLTGKTHSSTGARFLQRSSSTSAGMKRDIWSKSLLVEVWVLYIVESIGHRVGVWFCSIEPALCTEPASHSTCAVGCRTFSVDKMYM